MAIDIDSDAALETLEELFADVQNQLMAQTAPSFAPELVPAFDVLFNTPIQSPREALLGCAIARLQNRAINIRLPYAGQADNAFNARTLDEEVINPFLQERRIPASKGPYLAMFRRDFRFDPSKREGQRNKVLFDAFLNLITALEGMEAQETLRAFTVYLLYRFARLREEGEVPLSRLNRISLEQYDALLQSLLDTNSGGRLPVVIVVATFRTIKDFFGREWVIDFQGINVADRATGAGGDVTITDGGRILLAAEITERPVERPRVLATFNTKIAPNGIEDYLFFVPLAALAPEARQQAHQYFAQGNEVNFLEIKGWVLNSLATMGRRGRDLFNGHLMALMNDQAMPRQLKVAWNDYIAALTSVQ
jgi:hypothetical protein